MTTDADSNLAAGGPAGVRPLSRPTPLRESVYEALTEMIIAGSLQPGQHLVEVDLATMLGTSRQPVREALQRLHNQGWVDLRPGFGAMVDRKSTRLNSSHVAISYAVFCLKKKRTDSTRARRAGQTASRRHG